VVNVVNSYKLIEVTVDGKNSIIPIDTKEAWNVFEFEFEGETYKVNEGDIVRFITELGEPKQGNLIKISGKKEKTNLQIVPTGYEHKEIWSVLSIKEGTLKILSAEGENEDEDDTEDNE
jgi:hypothetical protein